MLDRQRTRREQNAVRVEDVIPAEILESVGDADREYLEQVFREPQKFLPPRTPDRAKATEPVLEPGEVPESRYVRRAKLAGLVLAGALVAGAVVAAPMLAGTHRSAEPTPGPAPAGFTGAAELGGAPAQPHDDGVAPGAHDQGAGPAHRGGTTPATGSSGEPGRGTASASATPSAVRPVQDVETPAEKLKVIRDFYAEIAAAPEDALARLAPVLVGGEAGELVRTWSSMDSIDVVPQDTHVQPDGSVLAVAVLHRPDGALVRVTQLFRLAEDGMIADAELISAQYT